MKIYLDNEKYEYELKNIAWQFDKNFCDFCSSNNFMESGEYLVFSSNRTNTELVCSGYAFGQKIHHTEHRFLHEKNLKNAYKRALYRILSKHFNRKLDWGILTGIRPTKMYREIYDQILQKENITQIFSETSLVSKQKSGVLENVHKVQSRILSNISQENYSVYVSVPFCPSKCNYCTFFSNEISKKNHLVSSYLSSLEYELEVVFKENWTKNRTIDSLYIGGGTPSSLEINDLQKFLTILSDKMPFQKIQEITFEAGRPDTIDSEKLNLIKSFGIDRISINPQTMVDRTLHKIGRNHSSEQIINSYQAAKDAGFTNINMDIIIGLEDERLSDLQYTLDHILCLNPDSITVHSLALKKASDLTKTVTPDRIHSQYQVVSDMMDYVYKQLEGEYHPYYLYRQKNIMGGQENVGFSKNAKESLYNILIIEEYQNILSFGPGAVSRFIYPIENRIERVSNTKNLEEYIKNIDFYINKKRQEMSL